MDKISAKEIQYRNISLTVRPARAAILIDENDPYWKHVIIRLFEWCSRVWGGAYFLFIPTDGKEIKEIFWQILEKYSPDLVFSNFPTIQDIEEADPESYNRIVENYKNEFKKQFPEFDEKSFFEYIEGVVKPQGRSHFDIDQSLQERIKQRLAPFYIQNFVVQKKILLPGHAPFPLTELEKIAVEGHQEKVYLVDKINDIDCSLAFYSNWGQYSPKFAELMAQKGIKIEHVPHNIRLADLLRIGINNTVDQSDLYLRKKFKTEDNSSWFPDEDITAFHPFRNSLMKLGRYRSSELFINDEPSTLIIGDTIFDFCLYYCLSRFQDYVFWIPELGTQDGNTHNFTNEDKEILFNTVLSSINQNINLGHSNNVQLLSLSLTSELLAIAKKYIPRLIHAISGISDDFMNRYIINPKLNLSEKYFYRYFELNNYTNLYTETFENNLGVGRIQTPKPKNFGYVHPSEHRWITELNIEGYIPPPLHFLGSQIIELAGSTDVSRVSNSGICYSCPNIAYFGGDIDVVLVRPRLKIVNAINIFQTYFYENGFMDVRISDKGNYAEETIKKFGSLERLGDFFKEEKNRQLFSLFLSTKSRKDGKGEVVFANGRAYIDFKSIHNSVGASEKATKLIDEFIKKGIFYRGLILQCPRCKEADWFDLEDISQQFICKRCKNKDYIQMRNWKESSEPTWYYKLDEVIYQGVNNNMEVPILTLSYLKRKSKRGLLYLPEVELRRNPTAHKPDLEIDICCIQDGQIVLGECKKNQITRKAIDKLNNFSLGLVRNPDRLIFASMSKKTPKGIKEYVEKSLSLSQDFLMEPDLVD